MLLIPKSQPHIMSPTIPSLGKTSTLGGQFELHAGCLSQQSTYMTQPVRYHVLVVVAKMNILHTFLSVGNVSQITLK